MKVLNHYNLLRKRLYDRSASKGEMITWAFLYHAEYSFGNSTHENNPRTFAKNVQVSSQDPCMEVGRCLLASSHAGTTAFPSLNSYKAQGAPPRPAAIRRIPFLLSRSVLKQKTGDTSADIPCKNSSHDFLRRHYPHQVKVEVRSLPLSPPTSSPVFVSVIITHP